MRNSSLGKTVALLNEPEPAVKGSGVGLGVKQGGAKSVVPGIRQRTFHQTPADPAATMGGPDGDPFDFRGAVVQVADPRGAESVSASEGQIMAAKAVKPVELDIRADTLLPAEYLFPDRVTPVAVGRRQGFDENNFGHMNRQVITGYATVV